MARLGSQGCVPSMSVLPPASDVGSTTNAKQQEAFAQVEPEPFDRVEFGRIRAARAHALDSRICYRFRLVGRTIRGISLERVIAP